MLKNISLFVIFVVAVMLFIDPHISYAACSGSSPTWTAASCAWFDIRDCQTVALNGDTIKVPAGTCTWNAPGGCSNDSCINLNITKNVNIIGAGIDSTTINAANSYSSNCYSVPIQIGNANARISGMTINDSVNHGYCGTITAQGNSTYGARIDHIKFTNSASGRALVLNNAGSGRGVVDHCTINSGGINFVSDTADWNSTHTMGTTDAWFFEDNTINYTSTFDIDCQDGGRSVVRHNTFNVSGGYSDQIVGNHGCDTVARGCMHMEIYNNIFNNNTGGSIWGIQSRSGTGRFFNNIFNGAYIRQIEITNYRSGSTSPGTACRSDVCQTAEGWPCQDQIGRSGTQASVPLYVWNNGVNAIMYDPGVYGTWYGATFMQANRDYFTCTDSSCAPGGYTAYTYPHPLTTGGVSYSIKPNAPSLHP